MTSEVDIADIEESTSLLRAAVVAALVVLALAGVYYWSTTLGFESTDDAFVEGTFSYLAPEIQGRVVEVAVRTHERVAAGQLLVQLDRSEALARLARARADVAAARNLMASTEAAAAAADARAKGAGVESWRAERELERIESLARRGAASAQELDAARAERDAALARVIALQKQAEAERGMLGSEAPLRQAEAVLREAELMVERTSLRAPFDAVVGRKNVDPGDIVRPGQALLALSGTDSRWIEANFKETQLRGMRVGSPARVEVDALPGYVFHGHIESFSPASGAKYALIPPEPAVGNFTKVVQRLPVRVALDEFETPDGERASMEKDGAPELALGLSARVSIDVR